MSWMKSGEQGKESIRSRLLSITPRQWIVILLLGLLLAVVALPVPDKKEKVLEKGLDFSASYEETGSRTELEEKLKAVLSQVEGVGKADVILMTNEEKDSESFYGTGQTKVTGVLIVAQGAGDPVTVRNIQEAVVALFQVEPHKIKIMKMK